MYRALVFIAALIALAGCNREAPPAPDKAAAAAPSVPAPSAPALVPVPAEKGSARSVKVANELYEFAYSYPAAAGAIPALRQQLDDELAKNRAELIAEAQSAKAEAAKSGFDYRPYSRYTEWKTVTQIPGWLSLSSLVSDYTGGAHPNYWFAAILWDKTANRRLEPYELFTSKAELAALITPEFCRKIDRERAKRRGEKVNPASGEFYDSCLDPSSYVVILGSSNRKAFDRIGVLVPPYEAGPYAEGSYEVTMPVTPAIRAAVRPEFRAAFAPAP